MKKDKKTCNFCGESNSKQELILFESMTDASIHICQNCIDLCVEALGATATTAIKEAQMGDIAQLEEISKIFKDAIEFKPSELKDFFDKYIINQDKAKKILAVAVYNHYKRTIYNNLLKDDKKAIELKKSNILMLGPSGCGKTLFVQTMAKKLGIPLAISDATSLTEAGYVGDDVETILQRLIEAADGDIEKAQKGIVFVDEIDKVGRKGENVSITRDVSGEGVQQALLKMLEGSIVSVPVTGKRKHPSQQCTMLDTSNILFICGGAFEGIEKIIEKRLSKKGKIGFGDNINSEKQLDIKDMSYNTLIHKVNPKDLKKFGLMPELIGRLPVICTLEELDREALVRILTEPVDSIIKQYKTLFEIDGVKLEFNEECLLAIADKAKASGTGARSLRSIIEDFMTEYMYNLPDMENVLKITLTKECFEQNSEPIYEYVDVI